MNVINMTKEKRKEVVDKYVNFVWYVIYQNVHFDTDGKFGARVWDRGGFSQYK